MCRDITGDGCRTVFEYKDNFLMGPAADCGEAEAANFSCFIKSEASEEFDELARLVGEGSTLEAADVQDVEETDLPAWTKVTEADAPRLEFDLEDELTRAFEKPEVVDPAERLGPEFGIRALQEALSGSDMPDAESPMTATEEWTTSPVATNVAAHDDQAVEDIPAFLPETAAGPSAPAIPVSEPETISFDDAEPLGEDGLTGMVSQEIERALTEIDDEAGTQPDFADEPIVDYAPVAKSAVTEEPVAENPEDSLEDFSLELARLMGEPDSEPAVAEAVEPQAPAAPPVPEEVVMPWEAPEIVAQEAPPVEDEPVLLEPDIPEFQPSYASTAPAHLPPAASLDVPPANSRVDVVLAQADAVEAAAAQDAELNADFDHDLEAALSRELDAELEASDNTDADVGPVVIPPIYMQGAENSKRQTGRRVAAGIVAVALLGGTAALAWSFVSSDDAEPPTILASSDPVKVKPEETGGKVVLNQDQSVYEAVDGKKAEQPKQEVLKDESEKPIAVAKAPVPATQPAQTKVAGSAQPDTTDPRVTGGPIVPPRRVRTVVVRPDGTILTQAPTAKPKIVALEEVVTPASPAAPEPVAVKTIKTTATPTETGATTPKIEIKPVTPAPAPKPIAVTPKPAETAAKPAVEPKSEQAVKRPEPKPVKIAKVEPPKPAVKKPVASAADPLAPTIKASAYVQVSSQRSQEAAQSSYKALARKYASVLGGKGVEYKRAKVKGRDYYRVRIPAASKAEAQKMCGQLKSKGGDCFVTR